MNTDRQRWLTNLRQAIRINADTPEASIDLQHYERITACGTLHCLAGELATLPFFTEQGMVLRNTCRDPATGHMLRELFYTNFPDNEEHEGDPNYYVGSVHLFGPDAWARLFAPYGYGVFDSWLIPNYTEWRRGRHNHENPPKPITDKELALARLRKQLAEVEALPDAVETGQS